MRPSEYQQQTKRTDLDAYEKVQARMSEALFAQLMHAAMGMVTEAGEFMDALKKHAMYGKTIDFVNLKEEIGDQLWYISLALNVLGLSFEDTMQTNIDKLYRRFPEKFTEEAALNRNPDAERVALESSR